MNTESMTREELTTIAARARREVEVREIECFSCMSRADYAGARKAAKAVIAAGTTLATALHELTLRQKVEAFIEKEVSHAG